MSMKPSIGRVVITGFDKEHNNGAEVCPAVITRVWSERPDGTWVVNVRALPDGNTLDATANALKTSVVLHDTEEQAREFGLMASCFWPPRV